MKRLLPLAFLVLLAPPAGAQSTASVTVRDFEFAPSSVTVSPNATVTWTWQHGGHSVTFEGGPDSGVRLAGATYQRTFPAAGTFAYFCSQHGSMTGAVRVVAASPKPTTTSPRPTTASPKPTTKSPTPTRSHTLSRAPTPVVTTASPTTASPTPALTTAAPSTSPPDTVSLDEPLPPDRTGLAIVLGLLVGLGGLGTATLLYLRRGA